MISGHVLYATGDYNEMYENDSYSIYTFDKGSNHSLNKGQPVAHTADRIDVYTIHISTIRTKKH